MREHRSTERSFYDRLQQAEFEAARELLETLLADPTRIYDEICRSCKSSGLFEDLKDVTPQDLSRYRQRKAREESRASVMALIESEGDDLINAAAKNPTGVIARFLRKQLTEQAVARFDKEIGTIDVLKVSREAARHAHVDQVDRKLDLEADRLRLDEKRVELQERQVDLQKDRLGIAAQTWEAILGWLAREEPGVVDVLTRRSEELLVYVETLIEDEAV